MLLLDADGVVELRRELIRRMGMDSAKALMMQLGYSKGAKDALLSNKIKEGEKYFEVLRGGLQLYGMTGFASVEVHKAAVIIDKGKFFAECTLHDSVEVSNTEGLSHEPLCWIAMGYASGYCSTLLGRSIVFKEITCRGMGHHACKLVGKTAEQWGKDAEPFFEGLRETSMINQRLYRPKPSYTNGLDLEVVGISPGFSAAAHLVKKVAPTDATVLFLGETGVGKEVFARMLHQLSARAKNLLWPSIVPPCQKGSSKLSFLALSVAPTPAQLPPGQGDSSRRKVVRFFWMRLAPWLYQHRQKYCVFCKKVSSSG